MTTEKKTALVTGASGTLGSAMAQALAAAGWRVAVHYHHGRDAASQAVENILAAGGEALAVAADLSSQQDAAALFQQIEERLGPVDCLVNNAGISRDVLLAFMSEEQWDEVIDTNLRATYVCSRLAVMGMMRSGAGSICNIVSPSGVRGQAGQCNYAASKGGMIAFTKALSREVGRFNIRVNAVCPGVVPSPMSARYIEKEEKRLLAEIPLGRFGRPEEVAALVLFLCSRDAAFMTGANIAINGGQHLQWQSGRGVPPPEE